MAIKDKARRIAYQLEWYHKNKDRLLPLERQRKKSPHRQAQRRAYVQNNIERHREYKRAWKKRNPDYVAESQRQYRREQPEKWREWGRLWRLANPIRAKLSGHNRRKRKLDAAGSCTPEQLIARFEYYGNCCAYCKAKVKLTVDHVIPLSRKGSQWPSNLRPACDRCNKTKGRRTLFEWKGRNG